MTTNIDGTIPENNGVGTNAAFATSNAAPQPTTQENNRAELIANTIQIAMDAAYGASTVNEQNIAHVLGELVRAKLLTAEDSYRLRDQLNDREFLDRILDQRIHLALRRRSLIQ